MLAGASSEAGELRTGKLEQQSHPEALTLWIADGVKAPGFWEPYCGAGLVARMGEAGNEGTADSSNLEQGEYARPRHACP